MLPLVALALVAQGTLVKPQEGAKIALPARPSFHVGRVRSLPQGALRKLLIANGAGTDVDATISLTPANANVVGRASMLLWNVQQFDPEQNAVRFLARPGSILDAPAMEINLKCLKVGASYLVVFNLYADGVRTNLIVGAGGSNLSSTTVDLSDGDTNVPCFLKATASEEAVTLILQPKGTAPGTVGLTSVDVHTVK